MAHAIIGAPLDALYRSVCVERVTTASQLQESYRLRYQVYCQDRDFLDGQDGIETDGFDCHSRHALIRWRRTGEAIGTVRLVLPAGGDAEDDFPIDQACPPGMIAGFSRALTGEVSRFALSKQHTAMVRAEDPEVAALLRLALLQGALWLSAEAGHTHWLAVMQPTLLRLLRGDGLHFQPLGPLIEYHGRRQPVLAHLPTMLDGVARERPDVWHYLTRGGTLFAAAADPVPSIPGGVLAARGQGGTAMALRGFAH